MKMPGKSDLLKKIWEGVKIPVKEHGGTLNFIQESEASTPAKDRTKAIEQVSRLEEARERARKEVKLLLAGGKEQELKNKLETLTEEVGGLEEELKQMIHNEAMGKEVIQETASDIQRTKTCLEDEMNRWAEAKERHMANEDDLDLRHDEQIKRKEKENLAEKVRNMSDILKEEEKKVEVLQKKREELQEQIDKCKEEKRNVQQELETKIQENIEHAESQKQSAEEKKIQDAERKKKLQEEETIKAAEIKRINEEERKKQKAEDTQRKVDELQRIENERRKSEMMGRSGEFRERKENQDS